MDASIKARLNDRIQKKLKETTGPSFEERVAASAKVFQKKTKATEDQQAKLIAAAVARAKEHPCESTVRLKKDTPPSVEECGREHADTRRENEQRYARLAAEQKHRMDTREPLFKLEEVKSAFDMQEKRIKENKRRMQKEEDTRWEHLRELQERVIHRPLLMEDGGTLLATQPKDEEEEKDKDPNWKAKFNAKMHKRITHTITDRSGPSFEERVAVRAKKFRAEAKATELSQTQIIEAAMNRAKLHPCESPFRPKELEPPSVELWAAEHAETRRENEARYAEVDAARKRRMDSREPLFKVSEVEAAFEAQRLRQKEYKKKLADDEKERWAFLATMQERVIDRPLLVEKFEKERLTKSNPDIRLVPNHSKPVPLQQNVDKGVKQQWFLDSDHGKSVTALHARMDARQKLHEIEYPPKGMVAKTDARGKTTFVEPPEKPCRPKERTDLDDRLDKEMNKAWFKNSEWASSVKSIQQRQDDRVPLSQLKYPVRT